MAKILVAEDDLTTNDLVSDYLIDAGHTVVSTYDGLDALECFRREAPELVVLRSEERRVGKECGS